MPGAWTSYGDTRMPATLFDIFGAVNRTANAETERASALAVLGAAAAQGARERAVLALHVIQEVVGYCNQTGGSLNDSGTGRYALGLLRERSAASDCGEPSRELIRDIEAAIRTALGENSQAPNGEG